MAQIATQHLQGWATGALDTAALAVTRAEALAVGAKD
jgi:hypothetical protein